MVKQQTCVVTTQLLNSKLVLSVIFSV